MLTYGEQRLAEAEERARRVRVRRRVVTLGVPALLATTGAAAALMQAQHARISEDGAGVAGHVVSHAAVVAFTVLLVGIPLVGAVRARRAIPAAIAFLAGPVLTPRLFGAGGWRWWEALVVGAVCALVSASALPRRAARAARPAAT